MVKLVILLPSLIIYVGSEQAVVEGIAFEQKYVVGWEKKLNYKCGHTDKHYENMPISFRPP